MLGRWEGGLLEEGGLSRVGEGVGEVPPPTPEEPASPQRADGRSSPWHCPEGRWKQARLHLQWK